MAGRNRNWLKALWIDGFKPKKVHYSDFFDSFYNIGDDEKAYHYTSDDLTDGARVLDHDLDTKTPDITIFADGVRVVEVNTTVELYDNGKGLTNSIKISHFDGAANYDVKIKR